MKDTFLHHIVFIFQFKFRLQGSLTQTIPFNMTAREETFVEKI